MDDCGVLCRRRFLGDYVRSIYFNGAAMNKITIDDLSHENSLLRARNERLEADHLYLITTLTDVRDALRLGKRSDIALGKYVLDVIISGLTGSAT
jgi:hypothetical protein